MLHTHNAHAIVQNVRAQAKTINILTAHFTSSVRACLSPSSWLAAKVRVLRVYVLRLRRARTRDQLIYGCASERVFIVCVRVCV